MLMEFRTISLREGVDELVDERNNILSTYDNDRQ